MRGLRVELLGTGATAGAAYFGYIDTPMMERALRHAAVEAVLGRSSRWMQRPHPPEAAARAIADGIERRKARVWLPRQVGGSLLLRGLLAPFDDRLARRLDVPGAVRIAESEVRESEPIAH